MWDGQIDRIKGDLVLFECSAKGIGHLFTKEVRGELVQ